MTGPRKPRGARWVWCVVDSDGVVLRDDMTESEARAYHREFPDSVRVARYFVGPVRLA